MKTIPRKLDVELLYALSSVSIPLIETEDKARYNELCDSAAIMLHTGARIAVTIRLQIAGVRIREATYNSEKS